MPPVPHSSIIISNHRVQLPDDPSSEAAKGLRNSRFEPPTLLGRRFSQTFIHICLKAFRIDYNKKTSSSYANNCVYLFYESVAMIKIAGTKSNDKINFKEFVDFFYKVD